MRGQVIFDWLRIFRAQTAPAEVCLTLLAYLYKPDIIIINPILLAIITILMHFISFGHNSLMDTAMGYDVRDPSKKHHPLVSGRISLSLAHNVIHWSMIILSLICIYISLKAPNPEIALAFLVLYIIFGHAYNDGLGKESILGFLPISLCFTSLAGWSYSLSHKILGMEAFIILAYILSVIIFQIGWNGNLKDIRLMERGNLLIRLGVKIENDYFKPSITSIVFASLVKAMQITIITYMFFTMASNNPLIIIWFSIIFILQLVISIGLIRGRRWVRERELLKMSFHEICIIFWPLPILLDWILAGIIMIFGLVWFFSLNLLLWRASYPRV